MKDYIQELFDKAFPIPAFRDSFIECQNDIYKYCNETNPTIIIIPAYFPYLQIGKIKISLVHSYVDLCRLTKPSVRWAEVQSRMGNVDSDNTVYQFNEFFDIYHIPIDPVISIVESYAWRTI